MQIPGVDHDRLSERKHKGHITQGLSSEQLGALRSPRPPRRRARSKVVPLGTAAMVACRLSRRVIAKFFGSGCGCRTTTEKPGAWFRWMMRFWYSASVAMHAALRRMPQKENAAMVLQE